MQTDCSSTFSLFGVYAFLLRIFSYNITPPQFWSSYLSVSTHFHVLITTSSAVFLSTCPNHLSLTSLFFSLMFAPPALALMSSPDLLNPLYSHHPFQHSHIMFFPATFAKHFSAPRSHLHITALNIKLLKPLAQGASRFENLLAPRKIYWPPFPPDRRLYS